MKVLESRTYAPDATMRKRLFTTEATAHPAKMHLELARDLFLRYTQPGQTVLDPFFGIGTSLIGAALPEPRNIIGHELEPPFVELARGNWDKIKRRTLLGLPLGDVTILQGDSRHLPLPTATDAGVDDSCVSSPPFGEMNAVSAGAGPRAFQAPHDSTGNYQDNGVASYSAATPGQIGNLSHAPSAILSSPPYGDVASRNRSEEPHSLDSPYAESHGKAAPNRHVDGYGGTPGQIGALSHAAVVHGCVSSPPFADSLLTTADTKRDWVRANGKPQGLGGSTFEDYGHSDGQIGALQHEAGWTGEGRIDYAALSSPPFANATQSDGGMPNGYWDKVGGIGHRGEKGAEYGASDGQIGNDDGETYSQACLAVYREALRVVRSGGVLCLVTGNYVRAGKLVDLAEDTIRLVVAAGWTPVERWKHAKAQVSFWRRLHAKRNPDAPTVTSEDVLVFVKHYQGWEFVDLPPTTLPPASLVPAFAGAEIPVMLELDLVG
ncbi:MAG TPA: DNA methyltransferase [Chloroflexota bacterium]|nr:DNA methyltransferase [Chloroflexota bacterium]